MEIRIGGDQGAGFGPVLLAFEMADEAACFADQDDAGGDVPRLQAIFPKAVKPARCDIGQIKRGRPQPAHAGNAIGDPIQLLSKAFFPAWPI